MHATLFSTWLALYILPFVLVIASWSLRSFLIIAGVIVALIVLFWIDHAGVPFQDQDFGYAIGEGILTTISVGAAAGIVARSVTLVSGWRSFSFSSLVTILLSVAAVPVFLVSTMAYERWERRPPTAGCVAKPSFKVEIGVETLSIPNWPLVMVSSSNDHFSLSVPTSLRRLCAETGDGSLVAADSATFFFDHVTSHPRPGVKAWWERVCRDSTAMTAALVCGERPIEQLSVYADTGFDRRTIAFGRVSSHAFFAEQQAKGRYSATEAQRHGTASAYPDGTWVFDDGSVFSCRQSGNGYPSCRGDFELARGLLAKVQFNAWDSDIEAAQRSAQHAVARLYDDVLKPTN
jgi:hypothetical protein